MATFALRLVMTLFPISAFAYIPDHPHELDLLKFSCTRLEEQNGQRFYSEIHFVKAGQTNIPRTSPTDVNSQLGNSH